MMTTSPFLPIAAALLLIGAGGSAAAGPPAGRGPAPPVPVAQQGGPAPGQTLRPGAPPDASRRAPARDRLRQRIRAMRAWYLTDELQLDDATAARLFPVLGRFDERIDEVHRRGAAIRRALRREMTAARPDSAAIDRLTDELLAQYDDLYRVQNERFTAVRRVVTPAQSAKLLLLLPKIDDAIRQQVRRAMNRRRGLPPSDPDVGAPTPNGPRKNRDRPGRVSPPFADPF